MADKKDVSTAIMDVKAKPYRLMVDEAVNDDNSVVALHPDKIKELQLFRGDTVLIRGKRRHDTVCILLSDPSCEPNKIRINRVVRGNLRVMLGDIVSVHQCPDIKYGQRVHILPVAEATCSIIGWSTYPLSRLALLLNHRRLLPGARRASCCRVQGGSHRSRAVLHRVARDRHPL